MNSIRHIVDENTHSREDITELRSRAHWYKQDQDVVTRGS